MTVSAQQFIDFLGSFAGADGPFTHKDLAWYLKVMQSAPPATPIDATASSVLDNELQAAKAETEERF